MTLLTAAAALHGTSTTTTTQSGTTTTTTTSGLTLPNPPYAIPTSAPYNVPTIIALPTYDGSGQVVHPDVVDMRRDWNGYRFWMAMTPYPYSDDTKEDPSILASNDAFTWVVPPGLTNPIHPWPGTGLWNADTDLSYDPDTDEMVCIFLHGGVGTRAMRSSDGITWTYSDGGTATTGPALSFTPSTGTGSNSPCLVREDDGSWLLWRGTSGSEGIPRQQFMFSAPAPEGPWTLIDQCSGLRSHSWHYDVVKHDGKYLMLVKDNQPYQSWGASAIFTATSLDGLNWNEAATPIIVPLGWARSMLYRPTLVLHENGTHMRVYYCGNANGVWRVGLTHVPLSEWPAPPTP